jgi:hypothetical protein
MQQATGLGDPFSEIFLQPFCKKYFEKGIFCQNSLRFEKTWGLETINAPIALEFEVERRGQ